MIFGILAFFTSQKVYEVCKLINESGNVAPDLAIPRNLNLGRYYKIYWKRYSAGKSLERRIIAFLILENPIEAFTWDFKN
ncbi:hypothetical protein NQ318_005511 [Aromia moschata]|uniref:Uncharacterized protein n=1 Tax=Aromia moschata TaxID=1265417 RepID=A0AAV8YB86_9CUCU|nr:hypothetical protein NQ318_005511 [Aromia moschata]